MNHDLANAIAIAIAQANRLELTGLIHAATERLRDLSAIAESETFAQPGSGPSSLESGTAITQVYAAGCAGLFTLAKRIGRPIVKIGTTSHTDVRSRISDLGWTAYGGYDPTDGRTKPGFRNYKQIAFQLSADPSLPACIELNDGAFRIALPSGRHVATFEGALRTVLHPYSTSTWASSASGSLLLKKLGMSTADFHLATKAGSRLNDASEFYLLSPSQQGADILALIRRAHSRCRAAAA